MCPSQFLFFYPSPKNRSPSQLRFSPLDRKHNPPIPSLPCGLWVGNPDYLSNSPLRTEGEYSSSQFFFSFSNWVFRFGKLLSSDQHRNAFFKSRRSTLQKTLPEYLYRIGGSSPRLFCARKPRRKPFFGAFLFPPSRVVRGTQGLEAFLATCQDFPR